MAKSLQTRVHTKSLAVLDDPLSLAIAPPADESEEDRKERLKSEAEAKRISDSIDEEIRQERIVWKKNKALFKLLLLGQSESGKSTTLKNFQLTFAPQAWQAERASWRAVIQLNLVRSVNVILDVLADEMASSSFTRPTSPALMSEEARSQRKSPEPSLSNSDWEAETSIERLSATPLQFTNKHALLKLRLAPLRHVESDLRHRLGAASSEVSTDTPGASASQMHATPFDNPYARTARADDLYLRSNRSWQDALHMQYQNGTRGKDPSADRPHEKGRLSPDNATEVIVSCCDDIRSLWEDDVVRAMLHRRKMRVEESSGL